MNLVARPRWLALTVVLLPWALAEGCRAPTQVTLDIRTNANCADLRGVDIIVTAAPDRAEELAGYNQQRSRSTTASTSTCIGADGPGVVHEIGTLVVTPDGDRAAIIVVAGIGVPAEKCVPPEYGPQCIVARRSFAFASHLSASLPIDLNVDCAGIPCNAISTCSHGKCIPSDVDCGSSDCTPPDADAPVDATPPPVIDGSPPNPLDASLDAPVSSDASADANVDAPSDPDASVDGGILPGSDAGITSGSCPAVPNPCLVVPGKTCTNVGGDQELCCYESAGNAECAFGLAPKKTCAGPAGCCRSATDCGVGSGMVCCVNDNSLPDFRSASNIANAGNTGTPRFSCIAESMCPPTKRVCQTANAPGECGNGATCGGLPFQQTPYKACLPAVVP